MSLQQLIALAGKLWELLSTNFIFCPGLLIALVMTIYVCQVFEKSSATRYESLATIIDPCLRGGALVVGTAVGIPKGAWYVAT